MSLGIKVNLFTTCFFLLFDFEVLFSLLGRDLRCRFFAFFRSGWGWSRNNRFLDCDFLFFCPLFSEFC